MGRQFKKKPKVKIICQLFYPELVSTGQTLTELCEELTELGVIIEVICGPPTILNQKKKTPSYIEYNGIKIKRVWGTRFPKINFFGKLLNQLSYALFTFFHLLLDSSESPMLVVTNPPFLGAVCVISSLLKKNPLIYLIFDVYPETPVKLGLLKKNSIIVKCWHCMNRGILNHASAVIVLGRCMKKIILNRTKKINSLPEKTHIIHVWSDDRLIKPVEKIKNPLIKKWNLNGKFIISYSGNMGRFHDMETIMEAASDLKKNNNIRFLFIGEGYKKRQMEIYAKKKKLSNCQFHTYVERSKLSYSLSLAEIGLVSLSKGQEGLSVPSKTFGILAAGVPVIALMHPDTEIAWIIKENNCGLVVEPGDVKGLTNSIEMLYSNHNLRKKMGTNALQIIKTKYNLRNAALKYYSIINSLQP